MNGSKVLNISADKITGNEENYDLKRVKKLIKDEFDIERFLNTFRELVKLHGDCDAKSVFVGCEIINKPKVKYCYNF